MRLVHWAAAAALGLASGLPPAGGAAAAAANEILFWRKAAESNLAADYRDYVRRFPAGDFVPFARARLGERDGAPAPITALPLSGAAEDPAAVEAMKLGTAERQAAQDGLRSRGFEPGPSTGVFDQQTRDALRAWQIRAGERATGYLTDRQYDELTTAPLSGALPASGPMTERLDLAETDSARAAREAALGYGEAELAEIEARLSRAGFDAGPEDGVIDAPARAAIRAYRQSRGFSPHEWIDRPMVDQLFRDTAGWPGPKLATR